MNRALKALSDALSGKAAPLYGILVFSLLALASCSGAPLKLDYKPLASQSKPRTTTIAVEPFTDGRILPEPLNPKTIGSINATVINLDGDKLTLSEDPAAVITNAFVQELAAAGYRVIRGTDADSADLVIGGAVKEFKLDIGTRDRVNIEVSARITDRRTGKLFWSGSGIEKADRFAGVMGDTRDTISKYISASVSKAVRQVIDGAGLLDNNSKAPSMPYEKPSTSPVPAGRSNAGRLSVTSAPPRAKVYIGDVYYGLTPITIDLDPGIYELTIKLKGRRQSREKISIRPGELTEVEESLDGE